jgi:hypothetical protein
MTMEGMYGPYPMTREASGTSWQPEATPHTGYHLMTGGWMLMFHGFATGVYDHQGGPRGGEDGFGSNMAMVMARRPLGPGTFGARGMFSLEPATMGKEGYRLLLQTGETADGVAPLIDRQHPHDLFMELALSYSLPFRSDGSVFLYFGLPGEPALGPPAFMHRFSGMEIAEAPITHHWLDSSHISEGAATLGVTWKGLKAEGSLFNGREPDENRWDIEAPRMTSYAFRLSYNPTKAWALQASYGHLNGPELLHPDVDTDRVTVSAIYHKAWGRNDWQSLLAWGLNHNDPGRNLHAFLAESTLNFREAHSILGRFERVTKDELFPEGDPLEGAAFTVNKLSLGYLFDLPVWHRMRWGIGGVGSIHILPDSLDGTYGNLPLSAMLWARVKLE